MRKAKKKSSRFSSLWGKIILHLLLYRIIQYKCMHTTSRYTNIHIYNTFVSINGNTHMYPHTSSINILLGN